MMITILISVRLRYQEEIENLNKPIISNEIELVT